MASTTCEKLVKYTLKSISKKYQLDYDDLKLNLKKVIKTAKNYDQTILGMMEEIMDLSNVASQEELEDFDIEVLKIYCKIKDLDQEGSDKHIRSRVWKNIESEFEIDDDDEEDDEEPEDSDEDSDDDEDASALEQEIPVVQEVVKEKKKKIKV